MQNQGFIIAREGFKFIAIGLALTLLSIQLGWMPLAWVMAGFTIFVTCFFRNPKRNTPQEQGLIIAPADGKICQISEAYEKRFLREPRKRISIFMSVFNCHINRSPISGKVIDTHYHPGKFHIASVDKASDLNEQNAVCIEDANNHKFVLVQIAGFVARRIVSRAKKGTSLLRGECFGLIQFGSRVDIYLPKNATVDVKVGQAVWGGETVLGSLK